MQLQPMPWHPYRRETDWWWLPRPLGKIVHWAFRAPADRLTLPFAAVYYAAGAILHATHAPLSLVAVVAGVAIPAVAYGLVKHRSHGHGKTSDEATMRAGKAAGGMLLAGAWVSTAAALGATAGPWAMSTVFYLTVTGLGYLLIRFDEVTRQRRDWRGERMRWHHVSKLYGLQGSHLLESERTRLGRRLTVDVKGTGKRASMIASRDTAERIAEHRMLPASRVQVRPHRIAGRITISIRERDPWAHPIPHPVLDDDPEIVLPELQSIMDPATIGQDPETGKPLNVTLYDEDGANGLWVVAITGGGKTVLLNNLRERLTACRDVLVWDINLSKAKEDRRWAPACDLTAHGPRERKKALDILRMAMAVIEYRGAVGEDAVHVPTPEDPAIVVIVDEMDELQGQGATDWTSQAIRAVVNKINSKKRSEGVVLIEAGQRGTITHGGSADIRANFNTFALGMSRSRSEMMHAAGDLGLDLPDMTTYGEGNAGVWLLATLGGEYHTGRTFKLKHLDDISKIAQARPPRATLPVGLREYLGDKYEIAKTGIVPEHAPGADKRHDWMDDLDKELAGSVVDILDQMDKIGETNRHTRAELDRLADEPLTELGPEFDNALRSAIAERNRQAMLTVDIPPDRREKILTMAEQGVPMRELVKQLGVSKTTVYGYLGRLRWEGLIEHRGRGAGARWHRVAEPPREASG